MSKRTAAGGQRNGTSHQLTKEELLARLACRTEEFELAPGVGTIILQSIPLNQLNAVRSLDEDTEPHDVLKRICLIGVRDPELGVEDLEAFDQFSAGAIDQIATRIMELSGLMGDRAAAFLHNIPNSKDSSPSASKSSGGSPAS